ncbi:MAG: lysophospholipase [Chloroflexi bacterium]|nr:lysophospholipase [Chloroflexota bacterium]
MSESETFAARDGSPLLVRRWPEPGEARATILIVHGLGDHSGRYEAVGSRLMAADLVVDSFDLRGFGASAGPRADVERWEDLLDDVEDRFVASRRDGLAAVLYGQSLGGLLVLDYLRDPERPRPELAVLSAPALGDRLSPLVRSAAPALARVAPGLRLRNPMEPGEISRDPAEVTAYAADGLVERRTSVRLGAFTLDAQERVNEWIAEQQRFPVPTLVLHGAADTIVPPEATEALGRLEGVERRLLPGVRHEPHHDPDAPAILDSVAAWIVARLEAMGAA